MSLPPLSARLSFNGAATILSVLRHSSSTRHYSVPNETVKILGEEYSRDHTTNVTEAVLSKVGRNLHNVPHHPINLIKQRIVHHFHKTYTTPTGNALYVSIEDTPPIVTTEQNFDSLLIPSNHVCRNRSDNYYINSETMLRAHTSAHQRDFVRMGLNQFLVTGDVYRRDEIDSTHYPVFHQMEGVRIYTRHELFPAENDRRKLFERDGEESMDKQATHTVDTAKVLEADLKGTLERLVRDVFGEDTETRWNDCYFPFTHPSYELEIKFRGEWVEMLGSGLMRQGILDQAGARTKVGWAFGLGLDRLAMLLFGIPDIRLLWSEDERFIGQFQHLSLKDMIRDDFSSESFRFKPYSRYPPCYKDISFWVGPEYHSNDFHELVRLICGDLVEKVDLIDTFQRGEETSHCYRITYCSMDRTVTNEAINELDEELRRNILQKLSVKLR